MSAVTDALVARMADAERRLAERAAAPLPSGLSDPDPGAEERWEAGQVWAHVAEFPAYWLAQARLVVAGSGAGPVPFGRTKADPDRIEAIERDRHTDPSALLARVRADLAEATDAARSLSPDEWLRVGLHPVRGVMTVAAIFERFIVDHLEEHADQLDSLSR
jgi:hypothetical protein